VPLSPRTISPFLPLLRGSVLLASLTCLLFVSGCLGLRSERDDEPGVETRTPTPALIPGDSGLPGSMESSVVRIQEDDRPEDIRGSAVVIDPEGFLLTSETVTGDNIEVVLPDGSSHRPALVTIDPRSGLALLKIPEEDLIPVDFSTRRPGIDSEVFATGFDGTPPSLGRMSGHITRVIESTGEIELRIRGPLAYLTDINLLSGFVGGALSDGEGGFIGIIVPETDEDGDIVARSVSHWYVQSWLQEREIRLAEISDQTREWDTISLPGEWVIARPVGWGLNVTTDDEQSFRAELTSGDPDVPLQLAYSVEPNQYGTEAGEFISQVFEDRSSARIWTVSTLHGQPLIRATISQEGALVDVAYVLGEEHMIAVSLTSGYQPETDQAQVDEARLLFDAVIGTLNRPGGSR
jgi:hypothetical protein